MTTSSIKIDPAKTWLSGKSVWGLVLATGTLLWVAFDFKTWVSEEIHSVRKEQVQELNKIGLLLSGFGSEFKRLATDVSDIKSNLNGDRLTIHDNSRRLDKVEAWIELEKQKK